MNVPKLRFKEFNDEWNRDKIGNFVIINSGDSPSKFEFYNQGIPYYKVEQLNNCLKYQVQTPYYINTNKVIPKGSIIFPKRGAAILLNKIRILNLDSFFDTNIMSLTTNGINNEFLYYYLIKENLSNIADTSSIPQLNNKHIEPYPLIYPRSSKEQEMVGKTLQLLDKKIELQTKKIEDLKLFKKGLIKDIFSADNLKSVYIKDLGTVITGTTPSKDNKNYWDNGFIAWITPTDITYDRDISTSITSLTEVGLEKGRYVPKNSVLVTCIASIGKNAVLKVDGSCNQQINAIIPNNNYKSNYIYYLMEYISPYLQSIAGTSATAIVNKETFENVKVNVHSFSEQLKIDKYLSSIESKILLEYKLLNKLFELKKGLMQNMFV